MDIEDQKRQLEACAAKLTEFSELIEPLFKAGHEGFAPDTDWWCVIAGWRHNAISDARMLTTFSKELDRERQERGGSKWLKAQMMNQRRRHVAESEVESPCGDGCVMTWKNQYGGGA